MTDKRDLDRTPIPYTATRVIANEKRTAITHIANGWHLAGETKDGRTIVRKAFMWDMTQEARRVDKP